MPAPTTRTTIRAAALVALAAHLALLSGLVFHFTDRLSFDTTYRPERGVTLHLLADGFRGLVAGKGYYHVSDPGASFGPFDPAADRSTPAQVVLVGAPFAAVPVRARFITWIIANEFVLLLAVRAILRRVRGPLRAIAFVAAWGAGTPFLVAIAWGSPVSLAAPALFAAAIAEGRAASVAFGLATTLRMSLAGVALHALRTRRWGFPIAAAAALIATGALFLLHPPDLTTWLTRHPYGESYPGNLGLQAFLFSTFRNLVQDRPISIPIARRVIYDLNILSLILQRLLVFSLVGISTFLSLRARTADQTAALATLWASTWILAGVEVREGDFLLVIAAAAAMAVRGARSAWLPIAALWLALPTPFLALPVGGIHDRSPEFAWGTLQTAALHGWKLIPIAILYWLAARGCGASYPNRSG